MLSDITLEEMGNMPFYKNEEYIPFYLNHREAQHLTADTHQQLMYPHIHSASML